MPKKICDNIYSITLPLPGNPLHSLNSYVITGGGNGRNLVIDTGFNRPECREPLFAGLEALSIRPEETDIFLTHMHSDHAGNAELLASKESKILISEIDYNILYHTVWLRDPHAVPTEGMPVEVRRSTYLKNATSGFSPDEFLPTFVRDGEHLSYGGYDLTCVSTPGHSPGLMCLYAANEKIMFTSDHVLFDITPNIASWAQLPDALGTYLDSLRAVRPMKVDLALPAHRSTGKLTMEKRIDQLLKHHEKRIAEAYSVVEKYPGKTCYEITAHMTWEIRAKNWESFPIGQKWFATREAASHLDYLYLRQKVTREMDADSVYHYYIANPL